MQECIHGVPEQVKKVELKVHDKYAALEIDLKNDDFTQIDQELDKLDQKKKNDDKMKNESTTNTNTKTGTSENNNSIIILENRDENVYNIDTMITPEIENQ
eukprot:CAMPEP_0116978018 /NCGR_PEP_ID=MMETSP0467-20121206/57508_1 /TAXON_ID=283647 /ORGANISM="Mesodinium pulex, Strain SPMC105" /LENGTH=100 /DNA_ID=CAMNT_0004671261 /DNA_START=1607 /DNA_END=1909 /DNA_ORIENTATION=-